MTHERESFFQTAEYDMKTQFSSFTSVHKSQHANLGHRFLTFALAPIVYLHSGETYFPTDLQTFLANIVPKVNFQPVSTPNPLDLNNLNSLGSDVWLTSKDDVTRDPQWIKGTKPDQNGKTNGAITAAVIVTDKGGGNVDAFYMYYFAYNYGGNVLGIKQLNFGNHVGDWEHIMVRFVNGKPTYIWYSQHANGQAFAYSSVHKQGLRPIGYISKGSHANYAIPGTHDHTIPNFNLPAGALEDKTDKGILWDPLLSAYYYKFNRNGGSFETFDGAATPTAWLSFKGRWGDQEYPKSDKRQVKVFEQAKFVGGPTGPADKQLDRKNVCPENGKTCILRTILVPKEVRGSVTERGLV
jgi:hypothetical protein